MQTFTVTTIIDGDTFEVNPGWRWNGQTGNRVRPAGYNAPELYTPGAQAATAKLTRLLRGEQVELRAAYKVDHGRLVCEVYIRNRNLADFFPEYH